MFFLESKIIAFEKNTPKKVVSQNRFFLSSNKQVPSLKFGAHILFLRAELPNQIEY